jgi:hypothetical protein
MGRVTREHSPTDAPVIGSDGDYDTGPEEDETDFLTQIPTVSSCEHRKGGDGWTETAEVRP